MLIFNEIPVVLSSISRKIKMDTAEFHTEREWNVEPITSIFVLFDDRGYCFCNERNELTEQS